MLSDSQILSIVKAEVKESIGYSGLESDLQKNRSMLMDSYNCEPYGDEIEGMSQTITADVYNVVEGTLPPMVRLFTQSRQIATFRPSSSQYDEEAEQKTALANNVFSVCHDPVHLIHSQLKDGMIQYTGILEVYWDDTEEVKEFQDYEGKTEDELIPIKEDKAFKIDETETNEDGTYNVRGRKVTRGGKPKIETVPPDEFRISKRARSFTDTPLIGKETPKTRSELRKMGFDKKIINGLSSSAGSNNNNSTTSSGTGQNTNPTNDRSKDEILLGHYYVKMDVDEDGFEELWLVYYADNTILKKEKVDYQPFCPYTPIPMPNRAIGTCPAAQVNDLQYWKTTLVRQLNNNIYANNYNRVLANDLVDRDSLLTPLPGGIISVEGTGPVQQSAVPLVTENQIVQILQAIEYVDTLIEQRSGVTRYNQGMDTESLNKTATGFQGIREMSQLKSELMARIYADTGLKWCFEKIIQLYKMHQDGPIEMETGGRALTIDPSTWQDDCNCYIDIGTGNGDRVQEINTLSNIYNTQQQLMEQQSPLVDSKKLHNTLERLTTVSGLQDSDRYFNDPDKPNELLMAENEALQGQLQQAQMMIEQFQQAANNQLAEAEAIKQKATTEREIAKIQTKAQFDAIKVEQDDRHHDDEMALEIAKTNADIREAEARTGKDIQEVGGR